MVTWVSDFSSFTTSKLCPYKASTQPLSLGFWLNHCWKPSEVEEVCLPHEYVRAQWWTDTVCQSHMHTLHGQLAGVRSVSPRDLQLWAGNLQSPLSTARMTRVGSQSLLNTGVQGILLGEAVGWGWRPDSPLSSFLTNCSECQLQLPLFNHSPDSSVKSG